MTARPLDPPIVFASDENFPAGSDPWSGSPAKIRPTDGILARGFLPGKRLPAAWVNYALYDVSARTARADLAEALNFSPRVTGMSSPPANVSRCAVYDEPQGVVWSIRDDGVSYSEDGAIWVDDTSIDSPTALKGIAHYGTTTCAVEDGKIHLCVAGVWASASIAAALSGMTIAGLAANTAENITAGGDIFYAFGQLGGNPTVIGISGATATARTLGGTLPTSSIRWVVAMDGFIIAVDLIGRMWTHPTGAGTWTRGATEPTLTDDVAAVFRDERRDLIVLITADGECWTSEDGLLWTERTALGADVDLSVAWVDGVAWEGAWLITGKDMDRPLGDRRLFVSTDSGVTWAQYPAPPLGEHVQCWVRGLDGDGLIAFGGGFACRSLRLK